MVPTMTSCLWPAFLPGLAPHAQDRIRGAAARGFSRRLPASRRRRRCCARIPICRCV